MFIEAIFEKMFKILFIFHCWILLVFLVNGEISKTVFSYISDNNLRRLYGNFETNYETNKKTESDISRNRENRSGKVPNVFPILNYFSKNSSSFNLFIKPDLDSNNANKNYYKSNAEDRHHQQLYAINDAKNYTDTVKQDKYDTDAAKSRSIKQVHSGRKKKKKGLFEKVFPMFVIPYLVQSAILPMMLMSLKFMLLKSFFIGKFALFLLLVNAFRRRNEGNDNMTNLAVQHYGYTGGEEYGAYVHN